MFYSTGNHGLMPENWLVKQKSNALAAAAAAAAAASYRYIR